MGNDEYYEYPDIASILAMRNEETAAAGAGPYMVPLGTEPAGLQFDPDEDPLKGLDDEYSQMLGIFSGVPAKR